MKILKSICFSSQTIVERVRFGTTMSITFRSKKCAVTMIAVWLALTLKKGSAKILQLYNVKLNLTRKANYFKSTKTFQLFNDNLYSTAFFEWINERNNFQNFSNIVRTHFKNPRLIRRFFPVHSIFY